MDFWRELNRRHLFRIAAVYAATSWLLIQLGAILFPAFNLPHWVLRVLVWILILGFPVALAITWIFEITPAGIRRTTESKEDIHANPHFHRRLARALNAAIIVALVSAVGALGWQISVSPSNHHPNSVSSIPANSIAVLPFLDLSPKHDQEYFAEGISEQLLDILAQATNLKVVARTSSFQFKDKSEDARKIGRILDARHILEGSVLRDRDVIRISVQLVNTQTGYHEWSHTYERRLGDIFMVQDDIARAIANALEAQIVSVGALTKADPPANAKAYDEYLLGRHLMNERTDKSLREALTHLKKTIKLDPDYYAAYAQIAIVYMLLATDASRERNAELAKPYLDHAIALEPDAPEAQAAQGLYLWVTTTDKRAVYDHFRNAVKSNPSYTDAVTWEAQILTELGLYRESWDRLNAGARRDPLNWVLNSNYLTGLLARDQFNMARSVANRFLAIDPAQGHAMLGETEQEHGHYANAVHEYLEALSIQPGWRKTSTSLITILMDAGLDDDAYNLQTWDHSGRLAALAGHRAIALEEMRTMLERYGDKPMPNLIAGLVSLILGIRSQAKDYFDQAWKLVKERTGTDPYSAFDPDHLIIYAALLQQAGETAKARTLIVMTRSWATVQQQQKKAAGIVLSGVYEARLGELNILDGQIDDGLMQLYAGAHLAARRHWFIDGLLLPVSLRLLPQFDSVRSDPRFLAIIKESQERVSSIHAQILPILCNWHYPADGWHPLPSTCEGVPKTLSTATNRH